MGNKTRMSALTFSVQHNTRVLIQCNEIIKKVEVIKIREEEIKLSLCRDNMIVYVENPNELYIAVVIFTTNLVAQKNKN